jgi:hypothetical protein
MTTIISIKQIPNTFNPAIGYYNDIRLSDGREFQITDDELIEMGYIKNNCNDEWKIDGLRFS